jgi:hypothetical protein
MIQENTFMHSYSIGNQFVILGQAWGSHDVFDGKARRLLYSRRFLGGEHGELSLGN